MQVQRLLVPAVVDVAPGERAWLADVREDLAAQGLLVDEFGPSAAAVHGVPTVLGGVDPVRLLRTVLEARDDESSRSFREQIAERFHSMACRAAVMSGDKLRDEEITALLQEAATLEHPHNCPHGRPTVLTFTSAELERYFRRHC